MLAAARASIESIMEYLGTPHIYCDSLGREILGALAPQAQYHVIYDDVFHQLGVHPGWWMFTKLLTYQRQTEPWFHFDLDFVMLRTWPSWVWDSDVGFQNFESWGDVGDFYLQAAEQTDLVLPDIFRRWRLNRVMLPNVGYLFCRNMEFGRLYADLAVDAVKQNGSYDPGQDQQRELNCVLEQQLLGLMLREQKVSCRAFYHDTVQWINPYFNHFVGPTKNSDVAEKFLRPRVDHVVRELALYLDSLKKSRLTTPL